MEEYQINHTLPKEVLNALGISRRQTLENEIKNLLEGISDDKKNSQRAKGKKNSKRKPVKEQKDK